ncbi:hypothetical protein [uncultured Thiodictyon sp.]|uniref:hypothetical protein n=1 Tax=uncultured Thiodictyon sp. TaxID=1846217 RepID=UPI0025CBED40|nr:hypothetical protein [uncultured Thiodictyon sp.]
MMTTNTSPLTGDAADELSRIALEMICIGNLIGQTKDIGRPDGIHSLLSGWASDLDALVETGAAKVTA